MQIRMKLLCAVALMLAMTSTTRAGLLDLELLPFPDIASRFIDVTYDSGTDNLNANGFALLYDDDGSVPSENIINGSFDLQADIDGSGNATAGSLNIGGTVLGMGPTLLTGTLTAFGFKESGGPLFEFVFTVTGGALADDYGGIGGSIGVILSGVNFGGDWGVDFDNLINGEAGTGSAVSDTGMLVPAPATLALLAAAGIFGRRRRRI